MSYKIVKSNIPWATHGWNLVVGCLRGCPFCYAKGIVARYGAQWAEQEVGFRMSQRISCARVREDMSAFKPVIMRNRLNPIMPKKTAAIFCSVLSDPDYWPVEAMDPFYQVVRGNPWHLFMLLTKDGGAYYKWPDHANLIFGYTATDAESLKSQVVKKNIGNKEKTFLSLEPLHSAVGLPWLEQFDWVIVGPENGSRKGKVIPKVSWFEEIRDYCMEEGIPLFEKPEVARFVDRPLVQQYPEWQHSRTKPR